MIDVSNDLIKRLYIDENKTMKEIGSMLGVSHWTVLARLKKVGVRKTTRHSILKEKFFAEFNQNSCYWAGFIAADGSIRKNEKSVEIELSSIDVEHLKNLCRIVGRDCKIWHRSRHKHHMVSMSLKSVRLVQDLKNNFNIISNKTFVLKPPNKIPGSHISHYIRGYIDGDGCIGWHKASKTPRIHVCGASSDMLTWVRDQMLITATSKPVVRKRKDNTYAVEFNGKQTYNILDWLYADSTNQTRLDRKHQRYNAYKHK